LAVIPLAGFLVACGGGSSSSSSSDTTAVTGSVVAAPVAGASVVVKDTNGNTIAGPVTTASDGTYTIQIPNASLASNLVLESSGGTYTDEATGLGNDNAGTLAAYIASGNLSAGSQVHMTPASTIVHDLVGAHGMALSAAQTALETAFGFAADTSVAPTDATAPATGAGDAQLLAGLRAAAFSQLTMDLGLTAVGQFDLLPALARDLADGSLDGMDANGTVTITGTNMLPADIQSRFGQAMVGFHAGANNNTGLANTQIGILPFAKVALTTSYKVEYVPNPMMGAMEGKTMFKVNISDKSTGAAATGLTPSLMPMMNMDTMGHATPVGGCTEDGTLDGTYSCTIYYLMASSMNGMSMGYWKLMVMAGMNESATFYPEIMMAMGDTAKTKLMGLTDSDMIPTMMGEENRPYYLFNEGLTGTTDSHIFNLFVAAKESMMSFPAVSVNTVLNSGDLNYELTAATMTVEVSSDASTWVAATDLGNGHWSAAGITGLTDGTEGTLYVSLTINGEVKTINDLGYANFTVTPAAMEM
jgi:hypothetical protein